MRVGGIELWRVILASVLGVVAIWQVGFLFFTVASLKERRLVSELNNMRTAIYIYVKSNGQLPKELKGATEPGSQVEKGAGQLTLVLDFRSLNRDSTGNYLDPFGKPYVYDPYTGWIRSTSPGYEDW